ncbi:AAA family ATPase [Polynucleobacter paneuropaeus]|nr:AAA family ATPase [Polynucleobacter paneuropaeus]
MTKQLINGQYFANSFLRLLGGNPTTTHAKSLRNLPAESLRANQIPLTIQNKVPNLFNSTNPLDKYGELFKGNISLTRNDHSAADLALCGHLARQGLTIQEADQVFRVSGLYRPKWDEKRGINTYGEITLGKAFGNTSFPQQGAQPSMHVTSHQIELLSPDHYQPVFMPNGVPPRRFVGPSICKGIRLFPANALSTLVALGAMGKTSLLLTIACHVAAGKDWNGAVVQQQKVAMIFCEEDEQEVSRKFSAVISSWSSTEQQTAIDNLRLIPMLGIDARLTTIKKNQYKGSGVAEELIKLFNDFGLADGLVIFDHMQGFASGDLNISETATAICREANKIVNATGSAVVFAAHISKANIKAEEVEQGFAVGSLAFENATRQMVGLIPMTIENAKKFGVEQTRREYVWLSIAKNSYGSPSDGMWLKKVISPDYHTVVMEPITLAPPVPAEKLSEFQKISKRIIDHITRHPNTTKNIIDGLSGKDGEFKASKAKVRDCLKGLIDSGAVVVIQVTDQMRSEHSIPKQVKEILRVNKTKTAN